MNITDIKIRKILSEGRLRAIVSITIDDTIALHDIKVIEGTSRLFVAMPSRRDENGIFRDIVHPITIDGRNSIEEAILNQYHIYLETYEEPAQVDEFATATATATVTVPAGTVTGYNQDED